MSNKTEATFHGTATPGTPEYEARLDAMVEPMEIDYTPPAGWTAANLTDGIAALVEISGENSRAHGFHEDFPMDPKYCFGNCREEHAALYRRAIAEKLALIHEEVSEALGEIRSGHDPLETYFTQKNPDGSVGIESDQRHHPETGVPLGKPEGFLVELADAVIRIADLVYIVGGTEEFIKALEVKIDYNKTRPYKHGRKF